MRKNAFKLAFKLALVVLVLSLITAYFIGCSQNESEIRQVTIEKASVETVVWFNKEPVQDPNEDDRYHAEQILGPKGFINKKYKYTASGYVDDKKYLKKHPDDGLMISSSNSDARVDVRVYSDNPNPDPEFFK